MTTTVLDSPTGVHTARLAQTARKPRAHAFFWTVLVAAATVSITGNATQALLHDTVLPAVSAAVAIIPPLALLATVHGVSLLSRAHTATRATRWTATVMTVLIAVGAFWLSFTALRSLAVTAGVPHGEAWLWPLIVEGSMAQATVALLALAHSANSDSQPDPAKHATALPAGSIPTDLHAEPAPGEPGKVVDNASVHTARYVFPESHSDFVELAARVCARDPGRRRDPHLVTKALVHHHDGWTPTRIAQELNKSRSTISRILSDAATLTTDQTDHDDHQRGNERYSAEHDTPLRDSVNPRR
ncbi:DUF2637 domain-containing protein [Nocardia sp. SC052]|uniref:DUF2637 domain-containing protein n=1 Tax=Nocardia sichangensis TaxID=3385975 RepID=UPI0039A1D4D3